MGEKKIDGKTAAEWFNLGFETDDPEKKIEYFQNPWN